MSDVIRVVSVSVGSSNRNHRAELDLLDRHIIIERIGTDGDVQAAANKVAELDGVVNAMGLGGFTLYLSGAGDKLFRLHAGDPIVKQAVKTPIVDGHHFKNLIEKKLVLELEKNHGISLKGKNVFLNTALDRKGMAEGFEQVGANLILGDAMFALGWPLKIKKLKTLHKLADAIMPIVALLPYSVIYPVGEEQNKRTPKFSDTFAWADVVAGDYLYIDRYMPEDMSGKIIIANTVTSADARELKRRGASILITCTPNLRGRSFGTNVMEAMLIALINKPLNKITDDDYYDMMDKIGFAPSVTYLDKIEESDWLKS